MENEDLEELVQKYKELGEKIENLKNKKKVKRWRAEKKDSYYFIDGAGSIGIDDDICNSTDDFRYKSRNYFKTSGEAQEYSDNINTYYELMDLAEELNNEEEINWNNNNQKKYYVYYDFYERKIIWGIAFEKKFLGQIYCLDENFLDKAIEKVGEERL